MVNNDELILYKIYKLSIITTNKIAVKCTHIIILTTQNRKLINKHHCFRKMKKVFIGVYRFPGKVRKTLFYLCYELP